MLNILFSGLIVHVTTYSINASNESHITTKTMEPKIWPTTLVESISTFLDLNVLKHITPKSAPKVLKLFLEVEVMI